MATGHRAFSGETTAILHAAILNSTPTQSRKLNPELPARLEEIINEALEGDRDVRYQHAADLRADLKRLKRDIGSGQVSSIPSTRAQRAPRKPRQTFRLFLTPPAMFPILTRTVQLATRHYVFHLGVARC